MLLWPLLLLTVDERTDPLLSGFNWLNKLDQLDPMDALELRLPGAFMWLAEEMDVLRQAEAPREVRGRAAPAAGWVEAEEQEGQGSEE